MIEFDNINSAKPYQLFKKKYDDAIMSEQKDIEAICISSYSESNKEVNARFVNLKKIINENFIFFSNYESQKAKDFSEHKQITALIFWNSINTQIRMKAVIKKTSKEFNDKYFSQRSTDKNAIALSSKQSKKIDSFNLVKLNYKDSIKNDDLKKCPDYWGGYFFQPFYFEFWEGHSSRLNKREVYELINTDWVNYFLQP